jgi:hypothetical protein
MFFFSFSFHVAERNEPKEKAREKGGREKGREGKGKDRGIWKEETTKESDRELLTNRFAMVPIMGKKVRVIDSFEPVASGFFFICSFGCFFFFFVR